MFLGGLYVCNCCFIFWICFRVGGYGKFLGNSLGFSFEYGLLQPGHPDVMNGCPVSIMSARSPFDIP